MAGSWSIAPGRDGTVSCLCILKCYVKVKSMSCGSSVCKSDYFPFTAAKNKVHDTLTFRFYSLLHIDARYILYE